MMIVNNAQLMRELKESEEIKQVINHLTQDIIDLYHIQIPIQDIDEAVKMFGGRVEEDREKYCKYCDFISKERDSFAIYISPYYKSERRKMMYEIEVVTDSIDSAALKQEKELLLKRIKEIDHLLNCGE